MNNLDHLKNHADFYRLIVDTMHCKTNYPMKHRYTIDQIKITDFKKVFLDIFLLDYNQDKDNLREIILKTERKILNLGIDHEEPFFDKIA